MEYLTKLRIEKAQELINSNPELILKDIADLVGYSDQLYFSRIFKIITGITPTEFKNK